MPRLEYNIALCLVNLPLFPTCQSARFLVRFVRTVILAAENVAVP
jgi:hypothetical protein